VLCGDTPPLSHVLLLDGGQVGTLAEKKLKISVDGFGKVY
jgi:hypothetical protein